MNSTLLSIKVDVDTDRGTRIGVPNLVSLFSEFGIQATFLFSLGPDNTGRAVTRLFRPGFLAKVSRTSVISTYGIRTLMNGLILPGPHIGRRNEDLMRTVRDHCHEVGIHCYDHVRWQDRLVKMTRAEVFEEFGKARKEFERIFNEPARTAGSAGWQANAFSIEAYEAAGLLYASDTRGTHPFFPRLAGTVYRTLQVPTTMPTLDELLGRIGEREEEIIDYYLSRLRTDVPNVLTIHAELEGMKHISLFRSLLERLSDRSVTVVKLVDCAHNFLQKPSSIPICDLVPGMIEGRSGTCALQSCTR